MFSVAVLASLANFCASTKLFIRQSCSQSRCIAWTCDRYVTHDVMYYVGHAILLFCCIDIIVKLFTLQCINSACRKTAQLSE